MNAKVGDLVIHPKGGLGIVEPMFETNHTHFMFLNKRVVYSGSARPADKDSFPEVSEGFLMHLLTLGAKLHDISSRRLGRNPGRGGSSSQ